MTGILQDIEAITSAITKVVLLLLLRIQIARKRMKYCILRRLDLWQNIPHASLWQSIGH